MNMSLRLGDRAPDFDAQTTQGRISFHEWLGGYFGILFSHPKDFTPVCTTELGYLAKLLPEFARRNVKVIGLSVDAVQDHERWLADIKDATGGEVTYPIIGDQDLKVAKLYGMLSVDAGDSSEGRTAATNHTVRTVFIIGPDKLIKAHLAYPMSSGRNFDEILRLIDSIQLTAIHKVATPVNWKHGEDVIILASVSDAEANEKYPDGWNAVKPYLRLIAQPGANLFGSD
jgi:alkyl hydroperoxide reductase subunit AhpC